MQKWPSLAGQHVGTLRVWIGWSLETLAISDALSPQSRGRPKVACVCGCNAGTVWGFQLGHICRH